MLIKYLKHSEIDKQKWNKAVFEAKNSLPYVFSWFLDAVSENWEALISVDYQYIMPLPVKKKFGIKYCMQPLLCQQLGIFSTENITENVVNEFVKNIPYKYFALQLNYQNFCKKAKRLPNLTLSLSESYENIYKNFSENTKRNIKKTENFDLKIKKIEKDAFLTLWKEINFIRFPQNFDVLKKIVDIKNDFVKLYSVVNQQDKIIAANLILQTENRIINLVPVSNEEGKEKSAMFFLLNELIKQNAEKNVIFDFEGSRIEGIARFYKGFGAKNEDYFFISKNRAEWLIKLIKKNHKNLHNSK